MAECENEIEQEGEDQQSIVQYILRKSTDFRGGSSCQSKVREGSPCRTREACRACSLPILNEAVVDVETAAHRPRGKLAIRDFDNVHETTDLLAPDDPGKLYSAIECKDAAGR